jgi:hypothetical protein
MSSRPNWGLNELDFVFSTLVVSNGSQQNLPYKQTCTTCAAQHELDVARRPT